MASFKVESQNEVMATESENVLLVKQTLDTLYSEYKSDYEELDTKWKGSVATVFQTYSGHLQTTVQTAITASKLFGENIYTFADRSKTLDDGANENAVIEEKGK